MSLLRRAFFWICVFMALFSAVLLAPGLPLVEWPSMVVIGTVSGVYLFFALTSRFLFTGQWRR